LFTDDNIINLQYAFNLKYDEPFFYDDTYYFSNNYDLEDYIFYDGKYYFDYLGIGFFNDTLDVLIFMMIVYITTIPIILITVI
jgi:hypothetical protein